jgi:rfaE bifunctional protein nucleotidyltransferase chain/domain
VKVLSERELVEALALDRAAGRRIVFANGCFDLLHVGHVRFLEAAAAEGDRLVVAINDDQTVAALKGPGRPVVPAVERGEIVGAFRCVDYVTIFGDATVERLLWLPKPDALQGDRLHRRYRAGARDRSIVWRAHGDRRRPERPFEPRSGGAPHASAFE